MALLLGHGHSTPAETATTGAALAMFALGLPGFCTYLYLVRVLQAMQRTRVAFYLYLVENGLNIVLALLLVHSLGVRGLRPLVVDRLHRGGVAGAGGLPPVVRPVGGTRDLGTTAPRARRVGPHGRRGARGVQLVPSTSFFGMAFRVIGSVVAGGLRPGAVVIWLGRRPRPGAVPRRVPWDPPDRGSPDREVPMGPAARRARSVPSAPSCRLVPPPRHGVEGLGTRRGGTGGVSPTLHRVV